MQYRKCKLSSVPSHRTACSSVLVIAFFSLPFVVSAKIVISEVTWMGTEYSHTDEWIELYNNGQEPVSLNGWTLSLGVLKIPLSGTIKSGEYALLERTDDSAAPHPALVIYKGALPNSGGNLVLMRQDGSIEDAVEGGANWETIGGDNRTKETAQRIYDGWQTAPPSPGEENIPLPVPELIQGSISSNSPESVTEPIILAQVIQTGEEKGGNERHLYYGLVALLVMATLALYVKRDQAID